MLCCEHLVTWSDRVKIAIREAVNRNDETSGHWFFDLVTACLRNPDRIKVTGIPEQMIAQAARETFAISSAAGLVPGPFGLAAIVPELISVTRIQLNLVQGIAKYHGSDTKPDRTTLLLIFGEAVGLAVGKGLVRRAGSRLVVRILETELAKALARKIGSRIVAKAVQKSVVRWMPLLAAPILGAFSRSMTVRIGRQADRLFSRRVVLERSYSPVSPTHAVS